MPTLNLTNITIKKLQDKNLNPYYLIVNNDNQDEAFFCFKKTVKNGWEGLVKNWENLKEVEIEYQETRQSNDDRIFRKVTSFWTPSQEEFLV